MRSVRKQRVHRISRPSILVVGLILTVSCARGPVAANAEPSKPDAGHAPPQAVATDKAVAEKTKQLLPSDPAGFLELCLEEGPARVHTMRCTFLLNSRIGGELSGVQKIDTLYRQKPRSVYFRWLENSIGAKRMLWVKGREPEPDGGETARLQPDGALGFIAHDVKLALDDPRIGKKERQPITSFGPDATLAQIVKDNRAAQAAGQLQFTYQGTGNIDGRATHVFIRVLPGRYPANGYSDARMVLHIDQEKLVPLSIESYIDPAGTELLESDVFTKVRFNIELTEEDFEF